MVNDLQAHASLVLSCAGGAELAHDYSFDNYYINVREGRVWRTSGRLSAELWISNHSPVFISTTFPGTIIVDLVNTLHYCYSATPSHSIHTR